MLRRCLPLLALLVASPAAAQDAAFPLKDGDIWVMAGDSITAQHLHSNYFEAFCYARYPNIRFAFRNSGVGGHTIPTTLARFDYDIAAWKPSVVSVELGMNDSGGTQTDAFIKNMGTMVARIRAAKARPVILSASPVNDGTIMAKAAGRNVRLSEYAKALKTFSEKEQIPYADQFHALVDVWGKNKPRENLANSLAAIRTLSNDDSLAGADHLKAFLAEQAKKPALAVSMQGDPVHPGAPGQLMMAAALLKRLGAETFVSIVDINPNGEGHFKGCKVTDLKAENGTIVFDRLDECLPFPIPVEARGVLPLAPEVLELSRYMLNVKGLKPGEYALRLDGVKCGTYSEEQLAAGINLTALPIDPMVKFTHPVAAQMQAALAAVAAKENVVNTWRSLSQKAHAKGADPKLLEDLAALTKKVEAADEAIRVAAKPKKIRFAIAPVK
jgi:lysophospholipase L1-like esterase